MISFALANPYPTNMLNEVDMMYPSPMAITTQGFCLLVLDKVQARNYCQSEGS